MEVDYQALVVRAGAHFDGIQRGFTPDLDSVLFTDPVSGAHLSLYLRACTSITDIYRALKQARKAARMVPVAQ